MKKISLFFAICFTASVCFGSMSGGGGGWYDSCYENDRREQIKGVLLSPQMELSNLERGVIKTMRFVGDTLEKLDRGVIEVTRFVETVVTFGATWFAAGGFLALGYMFTKSQTGHLFKTRMPASRWGYRY